MIHDIKELADRNKVLERSNKLMEAEINKLRSEISLLNSVLDNRCAEIVRLKHRSFWKRVFNL